MASRAANTASMPVGVMDSGIGGLTVWKEIVRQLPNEDTLYIADNANCPYGTKSVDEITVLADAVAGRLADAGCKAIVVACNTATAAAIDMLREKYPVPFIGMEPAVKPAALQSKSGVIGVLATAGTLHGRLFRETSAKFAGGVKTIVREASGWVELVESGDWESEAAYSLVKYHIEPLVAAGADYIVLGCTHFPFLGKLIARAAGPGVMILDPASAVAGQLCRILQSASLVNPGNKLGKHRFIATGSDVNLLRLAGQFAPESPGVCSG